MNYNELKNLIQEARATRRFEKDFEVSSKDLKEILDLARITSSAKNAQPIKYIIVTNKEDVLKIARTIVWAGNLTDWDQSEDERPSAFIIMLNDKIINGFPMFDAGASFTAISLAAKTKGLATCPMASINKEVCKELFDIPSNLDIMIGVAVGKGSEKFKIVNTKNGDTSYYRDKKQTHHVSKRTLEEIVIGEY